MLKTVLFQRRIRKIAKNFDGATQRVRGQLIIDLQVLEELAHRKAVDERAKPKTRQRWAQIAASIGRLIIYATREYDTAKVQASLKELEEKIEIELGKTD